MRLLKTYSHTSARSGYDARKNAKKVIEGIAVTIKRQTTRQKPAAYRQCGGGGRDEKGAMARQTTVKTLPRTVSVVGGRENPERRVAGLKRGTDSENFCI